MKTLRYASLLLALALTLTACADSGTTTTTAATTTSGAPAETTAVPNQERNIVNFADLSAGGCFNAHDVGVMQTTFDVDVDVVNCNWAHEAEIFASYTFPGVTGFPGVEVRDTVDEYCDSEFFEFVGSATEYSSLFYWSILPTQEDWDEGIQMALCALIGPSEAKLRGSAFQQGW